MVDRVPLLIEANFHNADYLATKAEKLGHLLLQTYLVTVAVRWQDKPTTVQTRYDRLEALRQLVQSHNLLLREEARPVATALFDHSSLIFHLGLDQANVASGDWYQQSHHPYVLTIGRILDALLRWSWVEELEFLVSSGTDPMGKLQVQIDRQRFSSTSTSNIGDFQNQGQTVNKPSDLSDRLQLQVIYTFSSVAPDK